MRTTAYTIGCIAAFLALCVVVVVVTTAIFFAVNGDAASRPPVRITGLYPPGILGPTWTPPGILGPTGPGSHAPHPLSFYANRPSA